MDTSATLKDVVADPANDGAPPGDINPDDPVAETAPIDLPPRMDILHQLHATEGEQAQGSALLQHCKDGALDAVAKLVREGAPLCFLTTTGWMPLSVASFHGRFEVVSYLLSMGAGEYYKQLKQQQLANSSTARQSSADKAKRAVQQNTPLHWACYKGHAPVVWALLSWGFSVDDVDTCGNQALHLACSSGNFEIVQSVLAHAPDLAARNLYGNTPLDMTTDSMCRKLLKKIHTQATCDHCKEPFGRDRRQCLCQQCHNIYCNVDPCSTAVEVPWNSHDSAVRIVQYCCDCNQGLAVVERDLKHILATKLKTVEDSLSNIHAIELDVRAAAILPPPSEGALLDADGGEASTSAPVPKDYHVKVLTAALAKLDSDVADVEALQTAISDAQIKSANPRLIQGAHDAYKRLVSHYKLVDEIKRVLVARPVTVRSSIHGLRAAWREAKTEGVSPILLEAATRVIVMAEGEVTLYGYYMLSARIALGSKAYLNDMTKLSHGIAAVEDKGVSDALLRNAKVLRDKLYAEMAMEEALMQHDEQVDPSTNRPVYVFSDGKMFSTLLEALNHRNLVVTTALDVAMKLDETTPISPVLTDQAKELLVKLKKDIKDEQKHEDERRRLEEEEAAKKAKKGKKGKKGK
ncbi:hypothetical protein H310_07661 [Aphanomyces invadans]|uniref:Uncharacterized protein n=1 Tax=Aphanomyces invadans TaxID=157072 RepID=A0A024U312_9STRA|nr:hypothetical protein H310_07661 [Aphanomyces invadans]ETW00282.1 hypothetical protein H310_07661 [Aphanomyces invadans]|eukprot:XP_008871307.1 hypothetical protein H310_07661 [Aphanomyces invadans]